MKADIIGGLIFLILMFATVVYPDFSRRQLICPIFQSIFHFSDSFGKFDFTLENIRQTLCISAQENQSVRTRTAKIAFDQTNLLVIAGKCLCQINRDVCLSLICKGRGYHNIAAFLSCAEKLDICAEHFICLNVIERSVRIRNTAQALYYRLVFSGSLKHSD